MTISVEFTSDILLTTVQSEIPKALNSLVQPNCAVFGHIIKAIEVSSVRDSNQAAIATLDFPVRGSERINPLFCQY